MALTNSRAVRKEQGFDVFVLRNPAAEVCVVPELGSRITSLKNLRTGREWMWHPADGLKLFRNRTGGDFAASPLVGTDECFPTIAPCMWQGRALPDHGELWSAAWELDSVAWEKGSVRTSAGLKVSPFEFERVLTLSGNEVRLDYRLTSRSTQPERFLWALHPLIQLKPADELQLPASTRALLQGADWLEDLVGARMEGDCAKIFAVGVTEGRARITNRLHDDWLEFQWNPIENNILGVWLTRGGWNGHHHFALEPSNGAPDALSAAAARDRCGEIPIGGTLRWTVVLRIGD